MSRPSCCQGSVYLLPTIPVGAVRRWAVCCHSCHRVLLHAEGSREEVYADL